MANTAVWFDVPAKNLERAVGFYSSVLGCNISIHEFPGGKIGVFPHEGTEVGGCIFQDENFKPSESGLLVYFNVQGRLAGATQQAEANGGKIVIDNESIGEHGFRSVVIDSEGNKIALHSM